MLHSNQAKTTSINILLFLPFFLTPLLLRALLQYTACLRILGPASRNPNLRNRSKFEGRRIERYAHSMGDMTS